MKEEIPIDPEKEVVAAIVHLVDFHKLDDGRVVARLPYEMAVYEQDLFQRTSNFLVSIGGSLQKEYQGFVFSVNFDYQGVIHGLLDADGGAEFISGDRSSEAHHIVQADSFPEEYSRGESAKGGGKIEADDLILLGIF